MHLAIICSFFSDFGLRIKNLFIIQQVEKAVKVKGGVTNSDSIRRLQDWRSVFTTSLKEIKK